MISTILSLYIKYSINQNNEDTLKLLNSSYRDNQNIESSIPEKNKEMFGPIINASSYIVIDLNTETVLLEKNPDTKRSIASLTKIMTNSIILEENNLTDTTTISRAAANQEGSTMGLYTGEEISIENLVYGSLIKSGNDASYALAEYNAGNAEEFVKKMNEKAEKLDLKNTHFKNPTGLDANNHYSTARDLSKLAIYAYQNETLKQIVQTKEITVSSENENLQHHLISTNQLLDSYLTIKGFKTGKTPLAGQCLIVVAENESGNEILTVILNSPDRFQESKALIDWTFRAYTWPQK